MAKWWAKNNRSTYTQIVTDEQKEAIEADPIRDYSFEPFEEPPKATKPKVNKPEKKK